MTVRWDELFDMRNKSSRLDDMGADGQRLF